MNDAIRMQLSAYVDGELPENEAELLLRRMSQNVELRREVAEFLAIGRMLRGEPGIAGADRLVERVAAAIDDRPVDTEEVPDSRAAARDIRPLVGFAIVATVALAAIFGLQQIRGVDDVATDANVSAQVVAVPNFASQQEKQRQYFLKHAQTSSALGANGINARLVSLRFSEEVAAASDEVAGKETQP
ncbi:MAG: hypothetical protein IIB75_05575 [Proteobacteria bacterium]|nr:hypothetical protein [Pseudomonadota bacterium]